MTEQQLPHASEAVMNMPGHSLSEQDYRYPPPADLGWDTPDRLPPEAPRPRSCW